MNYVTKGKSRVTAQQRVTAQHSSLIRDAQELPELGLPLDSHGLCKPIRWLICGRDVIQLHILLFQGLVNKVVPDADVLRPWIV